ncbi:hypothetical protein D3C86_2180230 [compost metagenome]
MRLPCAQVGGIAGEDVLPGAKDDRRQLLALVLHALGHRLDAALGQAGGQGQQNPRQAVPEQEAGRHDQADHRHVEQR